MTPGELKLRTELLFRLARHLQLRGAYAIADFPEDDISRDVRCMVQHAGDAAVLAEVLKAEEGGDYPEYASHRTFSCDDQAAAAIEARLREENIVMRNGPRVRGHARAEFVQGFGLETKPTPTASRSGDFLVR